MILAVDARELVPGRMTGIRRHLEGLITDLAEKAPDFRIFLLINQNCERVPFSGNAEYVQAREGATLFWDQVVVNRLLRKIGADVFYSPYFKVPFFPACKTICTVHDIMELALEEYRRERGMIHTFLLSKAVARYLKSADLITCDSRFTLNEVVRIFGGFADKMRVVPLDYHVPAVVPDDAESVLGKYGIAGPYVLYVGNFKSHKNLFRLLYAYELLTEKGGAVPALVLAGGGGGSEKALLEKAAASKGKIVVARGLSENELAAIYSNAALLVNPSSYEGFGYPVVEAFHYGVPVCCSSSASLPEVAGEAALYFNPTDKNELFRQMRRILDDGALRADLVSKGKRRLLEFTAGKFCDAFIALARGLA